MSTSPSEERSLMSSPASLKQPGFLGSLGRRLWSNAVDEIVGLMILRMIFRYRRHPPASAENVFPPFPALLSGKLEEFFQPRPPTVALWTDLKRRRRSEHQTSWDFCFPSPIPTTFPENAQVCGRLWTQGEPSVKRTVVGVDGVVQFHARWFQQLADRLTPAGIDVVMMDAPFNFRRTPSGYRPGQLILNGDLEHQLSVSRQAILDLWTLIANLQREGRKIGLVGVSFGGWMSLMAGLLAEDLEFITALAPPVDLERLLEEGGTIVRAVRRGLGDGPLAEDRIRQAVRAVTPAYWEPRLRPENVYLHAARYDRFVPTARIVELAERWGTTLKLHSTGHVGLTVQPRYVEQVADEILTTWP